MKAKRILASFLATLMLAGSLAACAKGDEPDDTKMTSQSTEAPGEEDTELKDSLPDDLNYGNDDIILISCTAHKNSFRGFAKNERGKVEHVAPLINDMGPVVVKGVIGFIFVVVIGLQTVIYYPRTGQFPENFN